MIGVAPVPSSIGRRADGAQAFQRARCAGWGVWLSWPGLAVRMELSRKGRETLERLEADLWREEIRFDRGRMSEVMAPDFLEFGRSGRVYRRGGTTRLPPRLRARPAP